MSYVKQMREINQFDPNGHSDDGGVLHPPVKCVLKNGCAHNLNPHRCRTLGECGAKHVYDRACEGPYQVIQRDNPVVEALVTEGKLTVRRGPLVPMMKTEVRSVFVEAK